MNSDQHQHPANERPNSVRKIVLPSGRSIEVVRFTGTEQPQRAGLHVCPACDSDLVQPLAWSEANDERWGLTLECPNCWWTTEGTFDREQVYELEDRLDEALAVMLAALKRLAHANLSEQIDRFVAALAADHILPEDF
jgi:hypothetical protein